MQIRDCMKRNVVSISDNATINQAAARFATRHIGTLPVVESAGCLIGVLQLRDLLALVMPDFVRLVEDFDFVHDFGAVEIQQPSPEMMMRPVREVMQPPIAVEEICGLLRAYSIMRKHDLHDLPVTSADGCLVGIASRVDIGAILLSNWRSGQEEAP
jgi:CBS-domain-containing membrane protein